jgi:hypothetical protein
MRTLAEVVDHLGAAGMTGIVEGTESRVRRPAAVPFRAASLMSAAGRVEMVGRPAFHRARLLVRSLFARRLLC